MSIFNKVASILNQKGNSKALLGTAVAGGLLGALFGGSKSVRNLAKNTLVIGSGAAAATLAYKLYQSWQKKDLDTQQNNDINDCSNIFDTFNQQARQNKLDSSADIILEALIFASRADGHIDKNEQNFILTTAKNLNIENNLNEKIATYLEKPLDANDLAAKICSLEQGQEIYALSIAATNSDHPAEREYLNSLAKALGLDVNTKEQIEQRTLTYKENFDN